MHDTALRRSVTMSVSDATFGGSEEVERGVEEEDKDAEDRLQWLVTCTVVLHMHCVIVMHYALLY